MGLARMEEIMVKAGPLNSKAATDRCFLLRMCVFVTQGSSRVLWSQNPRRILSNDECLQFETAYITYRSAYDKLTSSALQRRVCRWPCRPKQHQLEHMTFELLPLNPRHVSNFLNEDAIRRTKALAAKSHPAYMSRHVLFKYVLQQSLQWR